MEQKRAQLPARHELKYFIHPAELESLRSVLRAALSLDPHCRGGRPYTIRSLYFDDVDDSAYYDKVAGVMHRDKYRIRIYGDLIQKSSVQITRRLCEQLMDGNPSGLQRAASPVLQDMYIQMRTRLLRPRVIVDYEREAYMHPAENLRITFDLNLRSGLNSFELFNPDIATVSPCGENVQILEIKYDAVLPAFVRPLLWNVRPKRHLQIRALPAV